MLVLRLLVMVLTIICLMDGHAEVSSSTTGIRDRRESPAVKTNELEIEVLDRKKKKKPKPSKKKKPKPGKKKPKPNKAKPKPTKPVTTTTTMSTSTLKTTTILTTPTITTTATTTTKTVSPTTTATTTKTTTSTASATTTLSTTTTVATSSTASTTITTIPTTATTSSPPTTAATTADSGAGGECKATNGKPCIFPFKDGNEEYNECKNEGGKYFWCATSVYDSGKYKHWSYCSTDGPCPLEGDGECRATNKKPCVFPFKDGNKEYNECADHGGKYFWCATGTNSAGKYTAWSECPKDGSCPLPQKITTPAMTSTATAASTTSLITGTSAMESVLTDVEKTLNKINVTLQNLQIDDFSNDEKQLLETISNLENYLKSDSLTRSNPYDLIKVKKWNEQLDSTTQKIKDSNKLSSGYLSTYQPKFASCSSTVQYAKLPGVQPGDGRMFFLSSVNKVGTVERDIIDSSLCELECVNIDPSSQFYEYSKSGMKCDCYNAIPGITPKTMSSTFLDSGTIGSIKCGSSYTKGTVRVVLKGLAQRVASKIRFPPTTKWGQDQGSSNAVKPEEIKMAEIQKVQADAQKIKDGYTKGKQAAHLATAPINNCLQMKAKNFIKENKIREETGKTNIYVFPQSNEKDQIHTEYVVIALYLMKRGPKNPSTHEIWLYTYLSPCTDCLELIFETSHYLETKIVVPFNIWYDAQGNIKNAQEKFFKRFDELQIKYPNANVEALKVFVQEKIDQNLDPKEW